MNNATSAWISRNVERLRPARGKAVAAKDKPGDGPGEPQSGRSTHERLAATLRRGGEALSPRALRQRFEIDDQRRVERGFARDRKAGRRRAIKRGQGQKIGI